MTPEAITSTPPASIAAVSSARRASGSSWEIPRIRNRPAAPNLDVVPGFVLVGVAMVVPSWGPALVRRGDPHFLFAAGIGTGLEPGQAWPGPDGRIKIFHQHN